MLVYTLVGFAGMGFMWTYFNSEFLAEFGVIDLFSAGIQQVVAIACLWLLFTSPGKDWFIERS
jgi:hypothetical protein